MKNPIEITIQSYNKTADAYAANVANLFLEQEAKEFLSYIPQGSLILDVGCGSGRDAKAFTERGYKVIGVDLSEKLLEIASRNVPQAEFRLMNIINLNFPDNHFDGVWSNTSLLHIPKSEILQTINEMYRVLKKDGMLFVCTKEGIGEVLEPDKRYDGVEKFCSFFQKDELESYLKDFTILKSYILKSKYKYNDATGWLNILCKK